MRHFSTLLSIVFTGAACSQAATVNDSGTSPDAGLDAGEQSFSDAGTSDGGQQVDLGSGDLDAGLPMDFLTGRWRLVEYEVSGVTPLLVTDENSQVYVEGIGNINGRTNGLLMLTPNRSTFASALLFNDHIFPHLTAIDYATAMQAQGGSAPGVLDGLNFTVSGTPQPFTWTLNSDGTITQLDLIGAKVTWARAESLPTHTALLAQGQAALFQPLSSSPMLMPRVALAWDLPTGGYAFTNDSMLTFLSGYSLYPLMVGAPPNEALLDLDGVQVAIAYLIVYDDLNVDGVFDQNDALRGRSQIGVAYRSQQDDSDPFLSSRFRDLLPGLQYVHVHQDFTVGGELGVAPLDPTLPVSPDVLVHTEALTESLPDIVQAP